MSGPTAGGKSALAMAVARAARAGRRRPVEIVSADSVQVYRGFDIGSNKPPAAEQAEVPHHLIDIRDPVLGKSSRYTAADFLKDAVDAIRSIHDRGAFPLVVGGTGLYLRALLHGLSGAPPVPAGILLELESESDQPGGMETLRSELESTDPVTAKIITPGDRRRMIRAIGVRRATGKSLGEWNAEHGFREKPVDATVWVISPAREELHRRINVRTASMTGAGWIGEVRELLASGVPEDAPPFEAIGYRQMLEHVTGRAFPERDELEAEIALRTRQYAKQQLTWWRSEADVRWIDPQVVPEAELVESALREMDR